MMPYYNPYVQPYYNAQYQQQAQQGMTPPTIHAEIVQVDGEQAAANYPVGAGSTQMMMARDESAIYIKTANANGNTLDVYDKRPPAPAKPPFNPDEYVRRDELETLIRSMMGGGKDESV